MTEHVINAIQPNFLQSFVFNTDFLVIVATRQKFGFSPLDILSTMVLHTEHELSLPVETQ